MSLKCTTWLPARLSVCLSSHPSVLDRSHSPLGRARSDPYWTRNTHTHTKEEEFYPPAAEVRRTTQQDTARRKKKKKNITVVYHVHTSIVCLLHTHITTTTLSSCIIIVSPNIFVVVDEWQIRHKYMSKKKEVYTLLSVCECIVVETFTSLGIYKQRGREYCCSCNQGWTDRDRGEGSIFIEKLARHLSPFRACSKETGGIKTAAAVKTLYIRLATEAACVILWVEPYSAVTTQKSKVGMRRKPKLWTKCAWMSLSRSPRSGSPAPARPLKPETVQKEIKIQPPDILLSV